MCVHSESPGRHRLTSGANNLAATTQSRWFGEAERETLETRATDPSRGGSVIVVGEEAQGLNRLVRRSFEF